MDHLIIQGSNINPAIDFNGHTGVFSIRGRLVSVASQEYTFFKPLLEWVDRYSLEPAETTRLIVDLEFCSSAGIKNLMRLFKILEEIYHDGFDVGIEWKYYRDDEDAKEKGQNFTRLLKLPFKISLH
jgi:hypothetical protein